MSMVIERAAISGPDLITHASWTQLKDACVTLQSLQVTDGSVPKAKDHARARDAIHLMTQAIADLAPYFPHEKDYLHAVVADCEAWVASGFAVPDFYQSLSMFHPARSRVDGTAHLVVFPM